jgi:hypothetical protein
MAKQSATPLGERGYKLVTFDGMLEKEKTRIFTSLCILWGG